MVTIYLLRHASRVFLKQDKDSPLTDEGKKDCIALRSFMNSSGINPHLFLSSLYTHAIETAGLLQDNKDSKVIQLDSLTPKNNKWTLDDILNESREKGIRFDNEEKIMIVGHEGRLSRLLTQLTAERYRPFQKLEMVAVQAEDWNLLRLGKGEIQFRYPVYNFQEEALRSKVQSKMQVATFLAGFTFTTLSMLVFSDHFDSGWLLSGSICLMAGLFLFICAVYIYDRLSMPCGFWLEEDKERHLKRHGKKFIENLEQNGALYTYMIRTWNIFFTPAVILSIIGFLLCLRGGNLYTDILAGASVVLFVIIYFYYLRMRPKLGVD